jgi:hypothetical protein
MYLTFDLASPIMGSYIANMRTKNIVLDNWPRTSVNGVEVFDRLIVYSGSIQATDQHKEIYRLFGTSVEQLQQESFKGVSQFWFNLEPIPSNTPLPFLDTKDYLHNHTTLDEEITVDLSYVGNQLLSTSTIKANILQGNNLEGLDFATDTPLSVLFALFDINNVLYDKEVKLLARVNEYFNVNESVAVGTGYDVSMVRITYKRKSNITSSTEEDALQDILDRILAFPSHKPYSINGLIQKLKGAVGLLTDNDLYTYRFINGSEDNAKEGFVIVDGYRQIPHHYIEENTQKMLTTDYSKKTNKWASFLGAFVFFAAIALTIVFPPAGGGILAFLTSLSLNLTIALAVNAIVAYGFERSGDTASAISMGNIIVGFQPILTVVSIMTMVTGIGVAISKMREALVKEAVKQATSEVTTQATVEGAKQIVKPTLENYINAVVELVTTSIKENTASVLNKTVNFMNQAFTVYVNYISPTPDPGNPPPTEEPDNIDQVQLVQRDFEMYGNIDLNEKMQAMPYTLTEGTIKNTFNKYYVGSA